MSCSKRSAEISTKHNRPHGLQASRLSLFFELELHRVPPQPRRAGQFYPSPHSSQGSLNSTQFIVPYVFLLR